MKSENPETLLEVNVGYLKLHRLWPKHGRKVSDFSHIVEIGCILLLCSVVYFGMLAQPIHVAYSDENYIFADGIEDLALLVAGTGFYITVFGFLGKVGKISELRRVLSDFGEFGKPPTIDAVNKKVGRYTHISYWYVAVNVQIYIVANLVDVPKCKAERIEYDVKKGCGLMARVYPYSPQKFPEFHLYLLLQSITVTWLASSGTQILMLMFGMVVAIVARIDHLNDHIKGTFTTMDVDYEKNRLSFCIKYHLHIIKITNMLNQCFALIHLLYITYVSVVISIVGLQLLVAHNPKTLLHIILWCINLLLPCLAGQHLINKSTTISEYIYSTAWYNQPVALQKYVVLIIMRANKQLELEAKSFSVISVATFSNVMQTASSYLTMLSQTLDEHL